MTIFLDKLLELLVVVHLEIIKEDDNLAFSVMLFDLSSQIKQSFESDGVVTNFACNYLACSINSCYNANRSKTDLGLYEV